ncbi:MAG: hypothetical protein CMB75_04725 [Euryarchaeota archaeon]|nr:hypothetical protein [Euryarchaeota archaeon]
MDRTGVFKDIEGPLMGRLRWTYFSIHANCSFVRITQIVITSGAGMADTKEGDDLEDLYRVQIAPLVDQEAKKRVEMYSNPEENQRLLALDIVEVLRSSSKDTIPALMARLGPVRAALEGHGGALVVHDFTLEEHEKGETTLSLIIDLDGACVACGAAPGTLKGIQDDLLADPSISRVRFHSGMLEWFSEIQREFVLKHGEVTFL